MSEDKIIELLSNQNSLLMSLVIVLATGLIIMLGAVVTFIIGWNLRQDRQGREQGQRLAVIDKAVEILEFLMRESIPELYEKWDSLITGKVPLGGDLNEARRRLTGRLDVLARSVGKRDGTGPVDAGDEEPRPGQEDAETDSPASGNQTGESAAH